MKSCFRQIQHDLGKTRAIAKGDAGPLAIRKREGFEWSQPRFECGIPNHYEAITICEHYNANRQTY